MQFLKLPNMTSDSSKIFLRELEWDWAPLGAPVAASLFYHL